MVRFSWTFHLALQLLFCNRDLNLLSRHLQITHCVLEAKIEILLENSIGTFSTLLSYQPSLTKEPLTGG